MKPIIKKTILLAAVLVFAHMSLFAQKDTTLNKEVEVVKAYRPSISGAFKINDAPKIEEEQHQKPSFTYSINSEPVFSTFSVNPLQAAKITGKPREETGLGLIKLGAGNYGKPYADLFINTQSKTTLFGIHVKHLSSHGDVRLAGGDKVDAPFSNNLAGLSLKHNFSQAVLSFDASYDRDAFNYYGYPVDTVPARLLMKDQQIDFFGTRQVFSKAGFKFSLGNSTRSTTAPKLGFDLNYHYFRTKTAQTENNAEVTAHISKKANNITAMLDAGAEYYRVDSIFTNSTDTIGNQREIWLKANPAVKFSNENASLKLGGKFYMVTDNNRKLAIRVAPDVLLKINPVKGIVNFFAGIDGKYNHNTYSNIAYENPFVDPYHNVKNSMTQYRFFGGFNGKFNSRTNYTASVEYSSVKDQPFYYLQAFTYPGIINVADSVIITDNDFKILYDHLNTMKINLEFYYTASEKLNILLTAHYYSYNTDTQVSAWNMPSFDAKLSLGYKATDRLQFTTDIYLVGQRKGLILQTNEIKSTIPYNPETAQVVPFYKSYNMKAIVDLNVQGSYSITQDFSVFARLNNFGFQRYERWLGYPVQSFNFLGGISYSF